MNQTSTQLDLFSKQNKPSSDLGLESRPEETTSKRGRYKRRKPVYELISNAELISINSATAETTPLRAEAYQAVYETGGMRQAARHLGRTRKAIKDTFRAAIKDGLCDFRTKQSRPASTAEKIVQRMLSNPRCGLTGRLINWQDDAAYELDHVDPVAAGGDTTADNLMIVCPEANRAKGTLTLDEFVRLCCDVARTSGQMIDRPAHKSVTA